MVVLAILPIMPLRLRAQVSPAPETEVREVVTRFEAALQKHDLQAVEALVSPDIVVFENGHRNDGWQDFREPHLLPEFKSSRVQ
jgi:hypothetical protein